MFSRLTETPPFLPRGAVTGVMALWSPLDSQRKIVYLQRAAGLRQTHCCLTAMLTASLCACVMLLWAVAAPCKCATCCSSDDGILGERGSDARRANLLLPGSAPDLSDPRIGANMAGGRLALPPPERLIVAARYKEDILWMHAELVDLPYLVYQDGDPSAPLKVPAGGPVTEQIRQVRCS